jgi:hypothetical protein
MLRRLFQKPPTAPEVAASQVESFDLFPRSAGRFVVPDWDLVAASLEKRLANEDPHMLWSNVALHWLQVLRSTLGDDHAITTSDNFYLLAAVSPRDARVFTDYVEKSRSRILRLLDGMASHEGYGRSCVIAFPDEDTYYQYIASYYPDEGEFAFSSGMYINHGFGHFVCVRADMRAIEPIIVHELTHMLLSHLNIPAWLNEGLAVNTERILSPPGGSLYMPHEWRDMHQAFWTADTIQEFWTGKSFTRADEGNLLSYDLAQKLVTLLSHERDAFVRFVNEVDLRDSGQAAALAHLGLGLETAAQLVLGEGNWRPDPTTWPLQLERGGFAPNTLRQTLCARHFAPELRDELV